MKTKILFIAMAIVCSSLGIASAQKEKKVYGFAYSKYSKTYEHKILYISDVVSGKCKYLSYASSYECPQTTELSIQWNAKFKTIVEETFRYDNDKWAWHDSYNDVDKYRTEFIGRYKQSGWDIRYVESFNFRNDE